MKMGNRMSILIIIFVLSMLSALGCSTVTDDDTSRETAKPAFRGDNMIVTKEDEIQSKVIFKLKINYYSGTVFKVYASESAEQELAGYKITASSTGRQLFLETAQKGGDVKPGDYWVTAMQGSYKTSARVKLTVRDFDNKQIFKIENPNGQLEKRISESETSLTQLKIVRIKGKVQKNDLKTLRKISQLRKMDLSEAEIEGNEIPADAFMEMKTLKEVLLPSKLQKIGAKAFQNCDALETIEFGETSEIKSIEENAFKNCDLLTLELIMPDLQSIKAGAFSGNGLLGEVTLRSQEIPEFAVSAFDLSNTRITFHVIGEKDDYVKVWGKKYAAKLFCTPKEKKPTPKPEDLNAPNETDKK